MTIASVDDEWGMSAAMHLTDDGETGRAVAFADVLLRSMAVATVLGNIWRDSRQLAVGSPRALPATYDSFYHAVIDATLHLSAGTPIEAVARGFPVGDPEEDVTVAGPVVTVRQGLVSPMTNSMPAQNALVVAAGEDETVTVGGTGASMEDVEAREVELRAVDNDSRTAKRNPPSTN